MANNISISVSPANVGQTPGFDVQVFDDLDTSETVFVEERQLEDMLMRWGLDDGDMRAYGLAAWCISQGWQMADILHNAIDNGENIGTDWGDVEPQELSRCLDRVSACQDKDAIDAQTPGAQGVVPNRVPRL